MGGVVVVVVDATSAEGHAWCGSWALCWSRVQRFFPALAAIDLATPTAKNEICYQGSETPRSGRRVPSGCQPT